MTSGSPYAHVSWTHLDIYRGRGKGRGQTEPTHTRMELFHGHGRDASATGVLTEAGCVLSQCGYTLGPDGWRRPLDPHSELIATAGLCDTSAIRRRRRAG